MPFRAMATLVRWRGRKSAHLPNGASASRLSPWRKQWKKRGGGVDTCALIVGSCSGFHAIMTALAWSARVAAACCGSRRPARPRRRYWRLAAARRRKIPPTLRTPRSIPTRMPRAKRAKSIAPAVPASRAHPRGIMTRRRPGARANQKDGACGAWACLVAACWSCWPQWCWW